MAVTYRDLCHGIGPRCPYDHNISIIDTRRKILAALYPVKSGSDQRINVIPIKSDRDRANLFRRYSVRIVLILHMGIQIRLNRGGRSGSIRAHHVSRVIPGLRNNDPVPTVKRHNAAGIAFIPLRALGSRGARITLRTYGALRTSGSRFALRTGRTRVSLRSCGTLRAGVPGFPLWPGRARISLRSCGTLRTRWSRISLRTYRALRTGVSLRANFSPGAAGEHKIQNRIRIGSGV